MLTSELRVADFGELLRNCPRGAFRTAIDGGAGAGDTARKMLGNGVEMVHAFEPFPNNHRFFDADPKIRLHKLALGCESGTGRFSVASVVGENTPGWEDRVGYSSVGRLLGGGLRERARSLFRRSLKVKVVRADEIVDWADFVKLDLQGGEYDAICGMSGFLGDVKLMWVELISDMRIVDALADAGFELFSSELLFSTWSDWHDQNLQKSRTALASIGVEYHFGWRNRPWEDFKCEFADMKKFGLIQTDIVAVNPAFEGVYGEIVK
jgi:FkbM family methyltransferase